MSDSPAAALNDVPLSHVFAADGMVDAYLALRKLQDSAEAGILYPNPYGLSDTFTARGNGRLENQIEHCREVIWQLANSLSACQVPGFHGLAPRLSAQESELRAQEKAQALAAQQGQDGHS